MPTQSEKKRKQRKGRYRNLGEQTQNGPSQDQGETPLISAHQNEVSSSVEFSSMSQNDSTFPTESQLYFTFDNFSVIDQSQDTQIPDQPATPTTPLTPFSITSEAAVPRKQRKISESSLDTASLISSLDSVSIISSRTSSPSTSNKRKVGRPKKQTRKSAGRKPKNLPHPNHPNPSVPIIDFLNLLLLNFVTQKTDDPNAICNRTDMPLHHDNLENNPLHIEILWNNLTEWLEGQDIFGFISFLSRNVNTNTVVVDPRTTLPFDMNYAHNLPDEDFFARCYGLVQGELPQVIVFPLNFPGHWTLVVWDATENTAFYIDSTCTHLPSRIHADERAPIVKSYITRITNIPINDINIVDYPLSLYTHQQDGYSCGYFTCLYAESWLLNNRNMLFEPFNINTEKKRILWHLNNLLTGDNVVYHPRSLNAYPHIFPDNTSSHPTQDIEQIVIDDPPSHPAQNIDPEIPEEGVVVNTGPIIFMEPDPPSKNLRRSERIKTKQNATPNPTISKASPIVSSVPSSYPFVDKCNKKHKIDFPCADTRARHTAKYYDSGNLGDAICDYCKALLFKSEVHKAHKYTHKRIASSFCCKLGKVTLPPYTPHPKYLVDLLNGKSKESKEFLKNQNIYNTLLAFASISCGHEDSSLYGATCFMLNGEFSRMLSSMFSGHLTPSFSQLYILDANEALNLRTQNSQYGGDRVDPSTLKKLDQMLRDNHPFPKGWP
ncbi:unnamed protein product [Meloidogyne enterolobii]|uniref:Uncharacterized protein n=1 Tax=Meloidogyne enterolobii TaxID=390850 RepID=A0ACB1AZI5_MELEN